MEVYAPGVVKLFGEHAVVYGKTAVAIAITQYAKAEVQGGKPGAVEMRLLDFGGISIALKWEDMAKICKIYRARKDIEGFVESIRGVDHRLLPYVVIASRMAVENGGRVGGARIEISSQIPVKMGVASSAACSTAFAVALANFAGLKLTDAQMIEIARDGERIVHRNDEAGKIDVSGSYFGGCVSYNDAYGARRVAVKSKMDVLLVNSGPKKPTAETVRHVAELNKSNGEYVKVLLEQIEECTRRGLEAIESGDRNGIGKLMTENHKLLTALGVSNESLDKVVALSEAGGAYGAKLSGGGGGGLAIVLPKDDVGRLVHMLNRSGFDTYAADVSEKGAKDYVGAANG